MGSAPPAPGPTEMEKSLMEGWLTKKGSKTQTKASTHVQFPRARRRDQQRVATAVFPAVRRQPAVLRGKAEGHHHHRRRRCSLVEKQTRQLRCVDSLSMLLVVRVSE